MLLNWSPSEKLYEMRLRDIGRGGRGNGEASMLLLSPLVGEGSPMGTHTLALAWSAAECGQSHGYDPHMGPLATQCHFSNCWCSLGVRLLLSKRQSSLETPRTWIQPLCSYSRGCETLVAPCELARTLALEFLFGRGLGQGDG